MRIEHWNVPQNQGRCAASAIACKLFDETPNFWSAQGQPLRYTGYGVGYEDVIVHRDPDALKVRLYFVYVE